MDYKRLYDAYQRLLQDNRSLKAENAELRERLGESSSWPDKEHRPTTVKPSEVSGANDHGQLVTNASFDEPLPAITARRFGTTLLNQATMERHQLKLASYDRFFPNQDTLPSCGLGNLIALPLQLAARKQGNSVFIDPFFHAYDDQWSLLSQVEKLSGHQVNSYIAKLSASEVGVGWDSKTTTRQPWGKAIDDYSLTKDHFPSTTRITRANMLNVEKAGLSERALSFIRRMTTFKNPEFYKLQAIRMPIYNIPRIIDLSAETPTALCLPRGCEVPLTELLRQYQVRVEWLERRNSGRTISLQFSGELREDQMEAAKDLLAHDCGVLAATTAFGKTVIAAYLIAHRETNTLVLVHTKPLLEHWQKQLAHFLTINEAIPGETERNRGRKKQPRKIGQIGAGRNQPTGIIDVAMMQSLARKGEVNEVVKNYGMVIVDECHHVSAFSFEQVLRATEAKYVYGLTATPLRQDGHHPIVFMQCGPIRHTVDAQKQAEKRPFDHYLIPRFTGFRKPMALDEKELSISHLYTKLGESRIRNKQIVEDVIQAVKQGRHPLILTQRTAHAQALAEALQGEVPGVLTLIGSMSAKQKKATHQTLANLPLKENLVLIATGKYLGEGFDQPRLDTLFLVMPIAWKGILQQYAGRLHRLHDGKQEVQVYDYIDVHLGVFDRMYQKRLKGYASMGYTVKANKQTPEVKNTLFSNTNFLPVFTEDVTTATEEVILVSPYVTQRWLTRLLNTLKTSCHQALVTVITRSHDDYPKERKTRIYGCHELLRESGANLILKSSIHQKFAVIDQRIVWYGSVDLLSYDTAEGSLMRLDSSEIAHELMESVEPLS